MAKVTLADGATLAHALAENVAAEVFAIADQYTHVLFPATASGKNIAPRVAAKLDVAQISDITKVVSGDTFERPIYAGNAIATVQSADNIKVVTVRTTAFDPASAEGGRANIHTKAPVADSGKSSFVGQEIAIVVSLTLLIVCTLAAFVGSLLPLVARRIGLDPAVMSAPFISTLVDASGLVVYFLIARSVLDL